MKSKNFKNWNKKLGKLLFDHIIFHVKYNRPMLVDHIAIKAKKTLKKFVQNTSLDIILA